jgi:predicted transcriptional regulator
MSDEHYVLGENVTTHAAPSETPRTAILVLELEIPTDMLARLEALSEETGQSLEAIAESALAEYKPLRQSAATSAPQDSRDARRGRKRVQATYSG